MEQVEEGVANFKLFQRDMREFVTEFKTNERNKKETDGRRAKIHYTLLTLLIGLVIALFTYLLNHIDSKQLGTIAPIFTQSAPKENAGKGPGPAVSSKQQTPEDGAIPSMHDFTR